MDADTIARTYLGTDNIRKQAIRGINGWYYRDPETGTALIIDSRGNKLGAKARVEPRKHLEEFCRRYR